MEQQFTLKSIEKHDYAADILDLLETPDFKNIVELMRETFETDYAFITYFDRETLRITTEREFHPISVPKEETFCAHTIRGNDIMVVENAALDPRFANNRYVASGKQYRFYAGIPLVTPSGNKIGTVCIMDVKPRTFSDKQKCQLRLFANQVFSLLKLHEMANKVVEQSKLLNKANLIAKRAHIAINAMSDGLIIHALDTKIVFANPAACQLMNTSPDLLIGKSLTDITDFAVDEDNEKIEIGDFPLIQTIKTRAASHKTLGFDCENRGRIWLRIAAYPLWEDDSCDISNVVVTFSDITDSKNHLEELTTLNEKANEANQAKTAFLANMSHEIRTPLNGVIGIASALARTKLDEQQEEMVDLIINSGRTLETLLSDILDLSKVEAGQIVLENIPFSLKDAAISTANLLRMRADEKSIEFRVEISPNIQDEYIGDMVRIRQIIANLASNAIKFTNKGHVTLSVDVDENSNIQIKMADTGIGMDLKQCQNIFERFTQADNTITRRFGGTGLGLSITKALVSLMGGNIEVSSTPTIGSTFIVSLPLKANSNHQNQGETNLDDLEIDFETSSKLNVLLVEDHKMNQKVFSILSAPFGFNVTYANDGHEGINAIKMQDFDIIFMDMQMPVLDGISATKLTRLYEKYANKNRTPIVMLTANAGADNQKLAIDAGADFHLTKPLSAESLAKIAKKCIYIAHKFKSCISATG